MRHQLRPNIEGLESKALLSHLAAGLTAHAAVHVKILPHRAVRLLAASDLAVSLTTNQSTYSPGEIARMTLTLTNTSRQGLRIAMGPSIDGFNIRQSGKLIWLSNGGLQPDYIVLRTLAPGQSIVLTANWTVGAPTGSFIVHNQLFPNGPTAGFKVASPGPFTIISNH